jgi:hypothetical protein
MKWPFISPIMSFIQIGRANECMITWEGIVRPKDFEILQFNFKITDKCR